MAAVFLGVRLVPNQFHRIKLEGIDLENKVEYLKDQAAQKIDAQKQTLEFIYCGNILEDHELLSTYGVKPGVMIHVLPKKIENDPSPIRTMSETDIQNLVLAFRTFKLSPNYRTALQRISRPEVLENIIVATPGLSDDPVAIAMIQDPDLLVHMTDADVVRRIAELHPSLVEAANHIAAAVHEEAVTINPNTPGPSSGYSYSLEALSDDEEMDSSSSEGQSSNRLSYPGITAAQLAAALTNATETFNVVGSSPAAPTLASNNGNRITSEMFTNAMQQAFANVSLPPSSVDETLDQITRRFGSQLQQMHSMGLTNVATNIQALQATDGDVQAAIDLVFSGAISPDT